MFLFFLENFATTLASREQIAVAEFAKSILVIPKTLAVNAAQDSTELVAKLRALHNMSQTAKDKDHLKWIGLDLYKGFKIISQCVYLFYGTGIMSNYFSIIMLQLTITYIVLF